MTEDECCYPPDAVIFSPLEISVLSTLYFELGLSLCFSKSCPLRGYHSINHHLLIDTINTVNANIYLIRVGMGGGKGRREKEQSIEFLVPSLSALIEWDLFITKIELTPFPWSEKTDDIRPLAGGALEKTLIHVLTAIFTGAVAHTLCPRFDHSLNMDFVLVDSKNALWQLTNEVIDYRFKCDCDVQHQPKSLKSTGGKGWHKV